mmetsp:Transcript_4421/g.20072  ORF Transcript_4421/g.20072 Transcript_4421/m.20072 type:complete len:225 (+) Transcript_4421:38-712(+)
MDNVASRTPLSHPSRHGEVHPVSGRDGNSLRVLLPVLRARLGPPVLPNQRAQHHTRLQESQILPETVPGTLYERKELEPLVLVEPRISEPLGFIHQRVRPEVLTLVDTLQGHDHRRALGNANAAQIVILLRHTRDNRNHGIQPESFLQRREGVIEGIKGLPCGQRVFLQSPKHRIALRADLLRGFQVVAQLMHGPSEHRRGGLVTRQQEGLDLVAQLSLSLGAQ